MSDLIEEMEVLTSKLRTMHLDPDFHELEVRSLVAMDQSIAELKQAQAMREALEDIAKTEDRNGYKAHRALKLLEAGK